MENTGSKQSHMSSAYPQSTMNKKLKKNIYIYLKETKNKNLFKPFLLTFIKSTKWSVWLEMMIMLCVQYVVVALSSLFHNKTPAPHNKKKKKIEEDTHTKPNETKLMQRRVRKKERRPYAQ